MVLGSRRIASMTSSLENLIDATRSRMMKLRRTVLEKCRQKRFCDLFQLHVTLNFDLLTPKVDRFMHYPWATCTIAISTFGIMLNYWSNSINQIVHIRRLLKSDFSQAQVCALKQDSFQQSLELFPWGVFAPQTVRQTVPHCGGGNTKTSGSKTDSAYAWEVFVTFGYRDLWHH